MTYGTITQTPEQLRHSLDTLARQHINEVAAAFIHLKKKEGSK